MPIAVPPWIAQPTPAQIAEVHALFGGHLRAGRVRAVCAVRADGRLDACVVQRGPGLDPGFDRVIAPLAALYRVDPATGPSEAVLEVDFPRIADVDPKVVTRPTPAEIHEANTADLRARVVFRCTVGVDGKPAGCLAMNRPAPEAEATARRLLDRYRFEPARLDGRPVPVVQSIGIGLVGRDDTEPQWLRRPDMTQIAAAWPAGAIAAGVREGSGTIRCAVTPSGAPSGCEVRDETPPGRGFGGAALLLTPNFTFKPAMHAGRPVEGDIVVTIRFVGGGAAPPPQQHTVRVLHWAPWDKTPAEADVAGAYPAAARAKKVAGAVTFRCGLTVAGALKDCEVTQALPTGAGFEAGARRLLPLFHAKMADSTPGDVRDVLADVTIRFGARALDPSAPFQLAQPDWTQGPDEALAREAFPAAARAAHVATGRALVDCRVQTDGALGECSAASEEPAGLGFAAAALKLAAAMRMNGWTRDGEPAAGARIRVPLRLVDNARPEPPAKAPSGD